MLQNLKGVNLAASPTFTMAVLLLVQTVARHSTLVDQNVHLADLGENLLSINDKQNIGYTFICTGMEESKVAT